MLRLMPPFTHTHTKQAAYIPIPQSTSTVDLSTGAITHTIIIMPEAAKPAAVLRVKPSDELTTAPLFRYHAKIQHMLIGIPFLH